jgi:hypothetical protein
MDSSVDHYNGFRAVWRRASGSVVAVLVLGLGLGSTAASSRSLSDFQPSSVHSVYGIVSGVSFSTGLMMLEPDALAHSPIGSMQNFSFSEPVWMIGYRSEISDWQGQKPKGNHLCHTFFGDQMVHQDNGQVMKAIYSDAFTQGIRFPDGFGMRLEAGEELHWMPLFNNRTEFPVGVSMKCEVLLIREKDLERELRPLQAIMRSVNMPHLFFVPPGRHQHESTFKLPFNGRIHAMGTHIHPHGQSVELFNLTRQENVWKGKKKANDQGEMVAMEVYSNAEGYPVRSGETYRVKSVYQNPTDLKIDAMAGLFIFYSLDEPDPSNP